MNENTARKLSVQHADLSSNTHQPVQLFVTKEEKPELGQDTVYLTRRFRGDLLVYAIGIGIWMIGTIWLVVRLIDKFF